MLKVDNISYGYEKQPTVKGVSFSVGKGEFIGILGPNGSGKTALLKMLSGGLPIDGGSVQLYEKKLEQYSPMDLAKIIAVLPQSVETAFSYSVLETVEMGRYPYQKGLFNQWSKADDQAVRKALLMTNLESMARKDILSLSGGERQRVFLAQALAQEPSLFLLDEPTNHLDLAHQKALMDLLKSWTFEKGLTVISVFHDINLASLYCDQLLLMNHGTIMSRGTPWEVLQENKLQDVYRTDIRRHMHPEIASPQVTIMPIELEGDIGGVELEKLKIEGDSITYHSEVPLKTISSSYPSGMGWYTTFIHQFSSSQNHFGISQEKIEPFIERKGYKISNTIAMFTDVEMRTAVVKEWQSPESDVSMIAVVTIGDGNVPAIGDDILPLKREMNIWVFMDANIPDEVFIQAVMTATEAKTKALFTLGDQSQVIATKTHNSLLIASTQKGKPHSVEGALTPILDGIDKCVSEAVLELGKSMGKR